MKDMVGCVVKMRANEFIPHDLSAEIIAISHTDRKAVLKLSDELVDSGKRYTYAIASPHLTKDDFDTLANVGCLGCAVTWIPAGRFDRVKPFDLTWWRGGAAAITDLVLD